MLLNELKEEKNIYIYTFEFKFSENRALILQKFQTHTLKFTTLRLSLRLILQICTSVYYYIKSLSREEMRKQSFFLHSILIIFTNRIWQNFQA